MSEWLEKLDEAGEHSKTHIARFEHAGFELVGSSTKLISSLYLILPYLAPEVQEQFMQLCTAHINRLQDYSESVADIIDDCRTSTALVLEMGKLELG